MGWADNYIAKLQAGQTVTFRPRGHSMRGRVNDGDLCTVEPPAQNLVEDDIVLCRVKGSQYLHLIKAVRVEGEKTRYLIGNNLGHDNGWIGRDAIYGVLSTKAA